MIFTGMITISVKIASEIAHLSGPTSIRYTKTISQSKPQTPATYY